MLCDCVVASVAVIVWHFNDLDVCGTTPVIVCMRYDYVVVDVVLL